MREAAPHILVVDDEASIRLALATALTGTYVVWEAATGEEACRVLRTHPIAAIVLDVVLGEEHGLDLIDRFRALSCAPIVILTGHSTEELAIRALRADVSDYLKKPLHLEQLHTTLAQLLSPVALPPDPVTHASLHLAEQPRRHDTVGGLARHVGLSARQLRRRFKQVHGQTPQRHLTELRLQWTVTLLRGTRLGIKEIATAVGWSSVATFDRIFKRAFDMSPSEYRARHGQPEDRNRPAGGSPIDFRGRMAEMDKSSSESDNPFPLQ